MSFKTTMAVLTSLAVSTLVPIEASAGGNTVRQLTGVAQSNAASTNRAAIAATDKQRESIRHKQQIRATQQSLDRYKFDSGVRPKEARTIRMQSMVSERSRTIGTATKPSTLCKDCGRNGRR